MKLLLLTAVKSYEKQAAQLFKNAGILAFSHSDINGFKAIAQEDLLDNWFSSSTENVKSILFFTFAEKEKTDLLLKGLNKLNKELKSTNPLRAVVLNIETYH